MIRAKTVQVQLVLAPNAGYISFGRSSPASTKKTNTREDNSWRIFTACKRSLRSLCFHRRLSVHKKGGVCPGGLCSGDLCLFTETPRYGNVQAVHILLECILVTTRNKVGARLYFHRRVWFCSLGGLPQCMLGYHPLDQAPPWEQAPPQTRHPPGLGTPQTRQPPRAGTPPDQAPSQPGSPPPPVQSMLRDTVNARAVRILLECNLVL